MPVQRIIIIEAVTKTVIKATIKVIKEAVKVIIKAKKKEWIQESY